MPRLKADEVYIQKMKDRVMGCYGLWDWVLWVLTASGSGQETFEAIYHVLNEIQIFGGLICEEFSC